MLLVEGGGEALGANDLAVCGAPYVVVFVAVVSAVGSAVVLCVERVGDICGLPFGVVCRSAMVAGALVGGEVGVFATPHGLVLFRFGCVGMFMQSS